MVIDELTNRPQAKRRTRGRHRAPRKYRIPQVKKPAWFLFLGKEWQAHQLSRDKHDSRMARAKVVDPYSIWRFWGTWVGILVVIMALADLVVVGLILPHIG